MNIPNEGVVLFGEAANRYVNFKYFETCVFGFLFAVLVFGLMIVLYKALKNN